jgi:hypothetical protein
MAPHLYTHARCKFRIVHTELRNLNWIKNLKKVNTQTLLDEFILLFTTLNDIQLIDEKDAIFSKWTTSEECSVASAYEAQFLGAFPSFRASTIWQSKTEPKCRFFA